MAKSNNSFNGELLHFGAVRLRITGSGNLQQNLSGLDDENSYDLPDLAMVARTNREPVTLANFVDQMGRLTLMTTEIDETFSLCKIVIFIKEHSTGYPQ